ncbi:MAG: extracellular matrix regulator RemB [Bacillota bacterium]
MFLHIGDGNMILAKDIVFIGDIESVTDSKITDEFLEIADEEGFIIDQTKEKSKIRSFILTGEKIYYSIISTNTLEDRLKNMISENGGV